MSEYIITHEQLKRLFDWIDKLLPMDAKRDARLDLYTSLEVEEIVRCRDCVHFIENASTIDMDGNVIGSGPVCEWLELWVKPDGFCAWAERR